MNHPNKSNHRTCCLNYIIKMGNEPIKQVKSQNVLFKLYHKEELIFIYRFVYHNFHFLTLALMLIQIIEVSFPVALALFFSVYEYQLMQYILLGCSMREWWNNQFMWLIICTSSWFVTLFDVAVKLLRLSEIGFFVTPKGLEELYSTALVIISTIIL